MKLPKYVGLKSLYNNKYLRCRDESGEQQGNLQFSGDDAASRYSRFEVIYSSPGGLIHLKCCSNNKYWARASPKKWWVRCGLDKPVQDQSDWSCTLFESVPVDGIDGGFRFRHVQLKQYACSFNSGPPFGDCLYAGSGDPNEEDLRDVFVVIDASKKLPKKNVDANATTPLPRFVVLKSRYNHKYLRYRHGHRDDQDGFLQVSEENPTSQFAKFEVVKAKRNDNDDDNDDDDEDDEELVHLKCCYNNKYWGSSSEGKWWISGSAKKPKEARSHWSCTLFKPVYERRGNPESIRLQHVQLGRYACLFRSDSPFGDCLYAASEEPSTDLSDVFTFVDWESLSPPQQEMGSESDDPDPPKKEKWRPREEKPRRHRQRGEDRDSDRGRGRGRGRGREDKEEGHREIASDGEEEDPFTPAERRAEEKDEYGEYGSDGEAGKSNPNRRMWPPSSEDGAAGARQGITIKGPGRDGLKYMMVASANEFWGTLFASTAILSEADPDYYSKIKHTKGNGFTARSIRTIDFATGRMPQWKDWREQILSANHGSKELKVSVVRGGPLNQCGSFKTTMVVIPRFDISKPRSSGCVVEWKCEFTDAKDFDLKEMRKLVLRSFRRFDEFLNSTAARERV